MERLTSYKNECNREMICRYEDCDTCEEHCPHLNEENCHCLQEVLEKLAEYEDLEEHGKLLKLPCAVGDTVYAESGEFGTLQYEVDNIVINKTITYQCSAYSKPIGDCPGECLDEIEPDIEDFGKTVFLTQEEAKEVLQKMNETEG